ncbi:MAG: shikimate dehydrogenase [Chthoniobacteraceae bacterium]
MKEVYSIADLRDWQRATADCEPPLKLAVIGDPVAHSASPPMHNAALSALGIPARYTRLHIRPDELSEALGLLRRAGFIGINCTIPHKPAVLDAVDTADEGAKRAGGVNTVVVSDDGKLRGFSTDGPGFSRAVQESFGASLGDLRVVVLGAGGGAGRAIAIQCAAEQCPALTLLNRSLDKLEPLLDDIAQGYPFDRVSSGDFSDLFLKIAMANSDLVVNCTALGMKPGDKSPVPARLLESRHLLYDTIYVGRRTPLLAAGDTVGAKGANGLSMLLHQGALSFEIWFHCPPPIEEMRRALVAHFERK